MNRAIPPDNAVQDVLHLISNFYGDPALSRMPTQLIEANPKLGLILRLLSRLGGHILPLWIFCCVISQIYPGSLFSRQIKQIYGVSLTKNNERAIQRIEREILKVDPSFQINSRHLSWLGRVKLLRNSWRIARSVQRSTASSTFVKLNEILALYSLHAFYFELDFFQPELVLSANDHSPPTVGLYIAAKALRIPTVYVQHGPITETFPPLYTDIAFLLSEHAKDQYEKAATLSGKRSKAIVRILPASEDTFTQIRSATIPLKVCVALSRFVDLTQLQELIEELSSHKSVSEVSIARHPRCTAKFQDLAEIATILEKGSSIKNTASNSDLCLVANSGVALEFLRFGCPTFYVAPNDRELDDYYGFCAAGILPRFDLGLLDDTGALIGPFTDVWRIRASKFDPSFSDNIHSGRSSVVSDLEALIQERRQASSKRDRSSSSKNGWSSS